jgi:hypothetical protein
MKNYLLGILTVIIILGILSFTDILNQPEPPHKEWIIAPRFLTLQEGITKEEAREWMENEYLSLYRYYPGWNAMLGEPTSSGGWGSSNNNAKEKGDFVLIYFFDTKATKEHYFPPGINWREQADISQVLEHHQATFDKLFGKYFIQDRYQNEEYLMFARAK